MAEKSNNDNQPLREDSSRDYTYDDRKRDDYNNVTDTLKPPPRKDNGENTDDNRGSS